MPMVGVIQKRREDYAMSRIVLCALLSIAFCGPVIARSHHHAPPPGGMRPGPMPHGPGPRMGPGPGMHHGPGLWRGPGPRDLHGWRRGPAPHAHYRSCWFNNVWYDAYGYPYYYGSTTVVTPAPVVAPAPVVVTPAPVVAPAPVVVTPAPTVVAPAPAVVTPAPAPAVVY